MIKDSFLRKENLKEADSDTQDASAPTVNDGLQSTIHADGLSHEVLLQRYGPQVKQNETQGNEKVPGVENGVKNVQTSKLADIGAEQMAGTRSTIHLPVKEEEIQKSELTDHKRDTEIGDGGDTVSAPNPFETKLAVPVAATNEVSKSEHKPTTVPELFRKVESMVHHGGGKMTVSLNPPALGHVEIQVTTRGRNVEIQMRSENNLAKSTLESQLGQLRHSMQVQDLNLSKLEVQVSHDMRRMDMDQRLWDISSRT